MRLGELIPKEHGTWAMWIVPMLSAVVVTRFSPAFLIFFVCFALLYILHRPTVSMTRRKTFEGEEARWVIGGVLVALILGSILISVFNLTWLLVFGVVEAAVFAFSIKTFLDREQRSVFNELTVIASLTLSAPAAYYTITGRIGTEALLLYVFNFLFFGSSVFYVKTKIEFLKTDGIWRNRAKSSLIILILYHSILIMIIVVLALLGVFKLYVFLGFVPMLVQVIAGILSGKTRVNFKRLGVGLVIQSAIFLAVLGLFLRK